MDAVTVRLLLLLLDLMETLGKAKFTPAQRQEISEAREAAIEAMREQE